jgi:STE24 endopeptidase
MIVELGLGAAFLLAVLLCGLSSGLRTFLDLPEPGRVALYFVVLVLGYSAVSEPLSYYRGFVLPHRYGLSNQGLRSWIADEAKSMSLGLALGMCVVVIVYQFLRTFPETWWLLGFALVSVMTVVMARLAPVLILPLFFRLEPLSDPDLRGRLVDLAERSRTKVTDVYQINLSRKTSAGNAMLMGLGKTRRIAVSDTILRSYTPEEVESVMAHELGHHRHRDIARLIVTQSLLILLAFYLMNLTLNWAVPKLGFDGISDVAALPLLALILSAFAVLFAPLANAYSRRLEALADQYALTSTGNPEAFASMLTKLTDQNLNESQPGRLTEFLFYDHPPYRKRLEMAKRFAQEENR